MGQRFPALEQAHTDFIKRQRIFFVASAAPEGRVNLSPKGMDSLRILGPDRVAYLDVTGSGNETAAHLKASPDHRLTIMFCAFEGAPSILRLYGEGQALWRDTQGYSALISHFEEIPGARQIVTMTINLVQVSCGMAVPYLEYKEDRDNLRRWAQNLGEEGLGKFWEKRNAKSIDGFPTR